MNKQKIIKLFIKSIKKMKGNFKKFFIVLLSDNFKIQ